MSLINEMLRDLEARGGREPDASVRSAPKSRTPRRSVWPLFAIGALALALGIAAVMLRQTTPQEVATVAAPLKTMESERTAVNDVDIPAPEAIVPPPLETPPVTEQRKQAGSEQPPVAAVEETTASEPVTQPTPIIASAKPAEKKTSESESVVVRRHEPTREDIAARAGRDGFAALRNGDWATAARLLEELVAFEPANDDAREGLVVALTRQGRIAEADGALIDGVAVGAMPARFAKLRARLQAGRGELEAALTSLSIAVPAISADPEYHALKAALAQQAERYDVAANTYAALTTFEPANGTWQAGLGMALDKLGDFDGALGAYERALTAGRLDDALLAHVQRRAAALTEQER